MDFKKKSSSNLLKEIEAVLNKDSKPQKSKSKSKSKKESSEEDLTEFIKNIVKEGTKKKSSNKIVKDKVRILNNHLSVIK